MCVDNRQDLFHKYTPSLMLWLHASIFSSEKLGQHLGRENRCEYSHGITYRPTFFSRSYIGACTSEVVGSFIPRGHRIHHGSASLYYGEILPIRHREIDTCTWRWWIDELSSSDQPAYNYPVRWTLVIFLDNS